MENLISERDMLMELKDFIDRHGTQKRAALALGISETYLSDMVRHKIPISDKTARKLGFRREYYFQREETDAV